MFQLVSLMLSSGDVKGGQTSDIKFADGFRGFLLMFYNIISVYIHIIRVFKLFSSHSICNTGG